MTKVHATCPILCDDFPAGPGLVQLVTQKVDMVSGNRQSIKRSFKGAAGNFLFPIEIQRAFRTTLER